MELRCKRCNQNLTFLGERRFHEGTNWGALGELGELFLQKETLNLYYCETCRGVEFFLPSIPGPAEAQEDKLTWQCTCGEVNIRSEEYCRLCGAPRRYD